MEAVYKVVDDYKAVMLRLPKHLYRFLIIDDCDEAAIMLRQAQHDCLLTL